MESCPKCKIELKKAGKLNSANTLFQEYICAQCGYKKTKAIGVQ